MNKKLLSVLLLGLLSLNIFAAGGVGDPDRNLRGLAQVDEDDSIDLGIWPAGLVLFGFFGGCFSCALSSLVNMGHCALCGRGSPGESGSVGATWFFGAVFVVGVILGAVELVSNWVEALDGPEEVPA